MLSDTERTILRRANELRDAIQNTPATMRGQQQIGIAMAVFIGDVRRLLEEKDAGTATDRRGSHAGAWIQDAKPIDFGDTGA